jgi:GDPmannose 4,6-dehydratase
MWLMLQQPVADDFIIATGHTRSVRDFVKAAFKVAKITDWERYVVIDPQFCRPSDVPILCGDASKAQRILKWHPKTSFEDMVKRMVMHDLSTIS